jgi:hypothetical protein
MPTQSNDDILDVAACATYLHRSAGAVRMLVLRRAIPFRKPGGRLVFIRSEIEKWVLNAPGLTFEEFYGST